MTAPTATKPITAALILVFVLFLTGSPVAAAGERLHYALDVALQPDAGAMQVEAVVTAPTPHTHFDFILNAGLSVVSTNGTLRASATTGDGLARRYRVTLQTPGTMLELRYRGSPRFSATPGMGGMPRGAVDGAGVYLDRGSAWYPLLDGDIGGATISATVPDGWHSISIGKREGKNARVSWSTSLAHDDIYLIAGPFHRHSRSHRGVDLSVYLLDDDAALAETYLSHSAAYLDDYGALIGDYPYAKFAVVENRWETGYGMPSFTLLGPRVMRLPFIPFTSLPHEILHNWWGNGVWVDYAGGNWSEGLTAYLADHWMQERRGQGSAYRLKALQRYSNFAIDGGDMPLRRFVSRHSDASQSIGYSKSLMLFHMLRNAMGDAAFRAGLRRLWETHRFTRVGFDQVTRTLVGEDVGLKAQAAQWLDRVGAPRLTLGAVEVEPDGAGYLLRFQLDQGTPAFRFDLPIAVTLAAGEPALRRVIPVTEQAATYSLHLPARPLRLDVDPAYDVLRYLDPTEQPPALNRLFGAPTLLVLPSAAPAAEREAWQALAAGWQRRYPALQAVDDSDPRALDPAVNRLILGWQNRLLAREADRLARDDQSLAVGGATLGGQHLDARDFAVVLVNSDANGVTTGFAGAPDVGGIAALARKLPHYGSYGGLVFDAEGTNLRKDTLRSAHSRLTRQLGDGAVELVLPPRPPLSAGDTG
jgi:aminopeptidase N